MPDHFTPFAPYPAKPVDDELLAIVVRQQAAQNNLWLAMTIILAVALGGSMALLANRAPEIARAMTVERPA